MFIRSSLLCLFLCLSTHLTHTQDHLDRQDETNVQIVPPQPTEKPIASSSLQDPRPTPSEHNEKNSATSAIQDAHTQQAFTQNEVNEYNAEQSKKLAELTEGVKKYKNNIVLTALEQLVNDIEQRVNSLETTQNTLNEYVNTQATLFAKLHIALFAGVAGVVGAVVYECGKRAYSRLHTPKHEMRKKSRQAKRLYHSSL